MSIAKDTIRQNAAADPATMRTAQVRALLSDSPGTIFVNCLAAVAVFLVVGLNLPGEFPASWVISVLAFNGARLAAISLMTRQNWETRKPRGGLAVMSIAALISGLSWANVPLVGSGSLDISVEGYLFFIIGLICSGAMIQNSAHWVTAAMFPIPVILINALRQLADGDAISIICATTLLIVAIITLRICLSNQKRFIHSQQDKLQAVSLALSLSQANAEIMQSYDRLERQARTDPLTGLGNRALFHDKLNALVKTSRMTGITVALLVIDLDRFKIINDSLGHGAGDEVLKAIGRRLSNISGANDIVVRLGGDEFALIVSGRSSRERALLIGEAIVRTASEPIDVEGRMVSVGASAGLAYFPEHADNTQSLFASADIALYAAKEEGRRQLSIFNPSLKERLERQRRIEAELPQALASESLTIAYQPQVALATGVALGFEALLRWNHPVLGWINPQEIVEASHAQHMSMELTSYVAERAARFLKTLPRRGYPQATVAINVSPRDFADGMLADSLIAVAERHGIDPAMLEIEITEEATLDADASGPQLARLEEAGFRLAVDDFGAGHSSLVYLMNLKIDQLKIDRSFVKDIAVSRENQTLIAALIGIGRSLSIDVVVEGVETAEEVEILKMLGCTSAQGYFFARPMMGEQLDAWIAENARSSSTPKGDGTHYLTRAAGP